MENKFKKIDQIGLLVRNLNDVISGMRKLFGAEPNLVIPEIRKDGSKYRGKAGEFDATIAKYNFTNIELEFVQPLNDADSVWKDHLDAHGEGVQHLRFIVDNYEESIKQMAERGVGIIQDGLSNTYVEGMKWAYLETEKDVKFCIEMVNRDEILPEGITGYENQKAGK